MSDFGYGQLNPNDFTSDYAVTCFIVRQMMAQMDTMKLVQVKAVHGGAGAIAPAGTVDVLPLVSQIDGNGNVTPHGTVYGIPWSRVQGGRNAIVCDPIVGDVGYVVAADRDTSSVRSSKAQASPGSRRRFDIADGIYAGGCLNVAPNQYLVFTATGVRLVDANGNSVALSTTGVTLTDSFGNVVQMGSSGVVITGNVKVNGTLEATSIETGDAGLNIIGDITATGNITAGLGGADVITLQLHQHSALNAPPTPGH